MAIEPSDDPRVLTVARAAAVADAITAQERLIVEAGTGTGKTFAYLMPVLHSGRRVIISTGTRHLQDQLFGKDLPVVREALQLPLRSALLKGRSNYLCRHRLDTAAGDGRRLTGRQLHELEEVRAWSDRTRCGDIAELGVVPGLVVTVVSSAAGGLIVSARDSRIALGRVLAGAITVASAGGAP